MSPGKLQCTLANGAIPFRMAYILEKEPSNYMQTLTQYLSNIMNTVLLGLPAEMKELLYFLALSHAANKILVNSIVINIQGLLITDSCMKSLFHSPPTSNKSILMGLRHLRKT